MSLQNFPECIIANIAIFLVEFKRIACWAYRTERRSYIDMPSPLLYTGGWTTIVASSSRVMIKCSHYLDIFSYPFVVEPFAGLSMRCLLPPRLVLDILGAISQLCTEVVDNQILFNPGIGKYRMAVLYLSGSHLCLEWEDGDRLRGCNLANNIVGLTQPQVRLANEEVAIYVVRRLLVFETASSGYIRTTNDNNPDGVLLFRLFPSGISLSMTSLCFQHGCAVARVQAGHGGWVDIKSLPVSRIPSL